MAAILILSVRPVPLTNFAIPGSGHQSPGLWRHPDDQSWRFTDIDHWVELAKLLEKANFHGIFIADVLGTSSSTNYAHDESEADVEVPLQEAMMSTNNP